MYIACTNEERVMLLSALWAATHKKANEVIDAQTSEEAPEKARRNFEITAAMLIKIAEGLDKINPGSNGLPKATEQAQEWVGFQHERINRNNKDYTILQYWHELYD